MKNKYFQVLLKNSDSYTILTPTNYDGITSEMLDEKK